MKFTTLTGAKSRQLTKAHLGLVSVAFLDDAFEALSSVLSWAPVASSVESLASLCWHKKKTGGVWGS